MDAAQLAWCHNMHGCMLQASAAVASIAGFDTTAPTPQPRPASMHVLASQACKMSTSPHPGSQEAQISTFTEHALLITDYTSLMSALVPQLDRLGYSVSTHAIRSTLNIRQEVFLQLWVLLFSGTGVLRVVLQALPSVMLRQVQHFHRPLYLALHRLLKWLLSFSRSPAWSVKTKDHLQKRSAELQSILLVPARCLENISYAPEASLTQHLSLFPDSFVPLLCCLVSDQFGGMNPVVMPVSQSASATTGAHNSAHRSFYTSNPYESFLFFVITDGIHNLHLRLNDSVDFSGPFAFLRAPAVLHYLKIASIRAGGFPPSPDNLQELGIRTLFCLWNDLANLNPFFGMVNALLPSNEANQDAVGLPIHLDPLLSKPALETDVRLLHILSRLTDSNSDLREVCLHTQVLIMHSWAIAGHQFHYPVAATAAAALVTMVSSVVGIAKQCARDGLHLMRYKSVRLSQERQEAKKHDVQSRRQAQLTPPSQGAVGVSSQADVGGVAGMEALRRVMNNSSIFQALHQDPTGMLQRKGDPRYATLNTWCGMPGWAAVTELLQRGQHRLCKPGDITRAAQNAAESLLLALAETGDNTVLCTRVSLSATLRKLLWPHLQLDWCSAAGQKQRQKSSSDAKSESQLDLDEEQKLWESKRMEWVGWFGYTLHIVVIELNSMLARGACRAANVGGGGSGGGVINLSNTSIGLADSKQMSSNSRKTSDPDMVSPVRQVQAEVTQSGCKNAGINNFPASSPVSQLLTISLVTLVQVCLWVMEQRASKTPRQIETPKWLTDVLATCGSLHCRDVSAVTTSLLGGSNPFVPTPQTKVDAIWEKYASKHLYSRLLPGCCHLGCTNLEGVCEAVLKTKLCSGCRRPRYCSMECQKAAWREGGHSIVCGI